MVACKSLCWLPVTLQEPNSFFLLVHLSTIRCMFAPEYLVQEESGLPEGGVRAGTAASWLAGSRCHTQQPAEPSTEELWFPSVLCVQSPAAGTQRCPDPHQPPMGQITCRVWSVSPQHSHRKQGSRGWRTWTIPGTGPTLQER